jgi:hypothetical protein
VTSRAVQANLTHVTGPGEQALEEWHFARPRGSKLRVKTDCRPDPAFRRRECARALKRAWYRRYGQHIEPARDALRNNGFGIRIEVEVTMQVDHGQVIVLKKVRNSSVPRRTTST